MIAVVASNPFPGLRPFEAHQADFFFGRDEQIEELLGRLDKMRFVAVLGTSGSGKSSLVRAGLIPALQRGYLGGGSWQTIIVRPGSDPIVELAAALSSAFHISPSETHPTLQRSSLGLAEFAREHLQSDHNLLVIIDQFEELIRYRNEASERGGKEESAAFVKLLLAATGHSELPAPGSGELRIYVVLTIRSEFLGKCSQFRGLPEALNDSQYLVPRMTREQQREAIEGPMGMAGTRITPQLIQRLLNDVGDSPDQLPVLQHALMRMWDQSSEAREQGKPIDLPHYESVGRMERALNLDADRAFDELGADPNREAIARRLFQLLVEPGAEAEETRRPSVLSEIVSVTGADKSEVRQVIDIFHRNGFVMLSEGVDDPVVDISHESLIRLWDRLKTWVKEEGESSETYLRLANSAIKDMALYRDPELTQALRWRQRESPNAAWAMRYSRPGSNAFYQAMDFLERSRRTRERHQWMRRAVFLVLCLLSVVLGVLAFVAWKNAHAATESARLAEMNAAEAGKQRVEALLQKAEADKQRQQADSERIRADEQWKAAEKARKEADRIRSMSASARREVSGRHLANEAATLRRENASNFEISTLLAIESVRRSQSPENDGELRESLHLLRKVSPGTTPAGAVWKRTGVSNPDSVTLSPDAHYVVIDEGLFELPKGTEVFWRPDDQFHVVGKPGFSPDGHFVAINSLQNFSDLTVHVFDLDRRTGKDTLPLSSDGRQDLPPPEQRGMLAVGAGVDGRTAAGYAPVVYSADGKHVVVAVSNSDSSLPYTPVLLDAETGKQISPLAHAESMLHALVFSPDSRWVAAADDDGLTLFQASTGKEVYHVPYPGPTTVAYSPDGRLLATAAGKTVGIFEVATMNETVKLNLDDTVHSIAFKKDGQVRIASGSRAISVQDYPVSWTDLARDACSSVSRNLTHEEWQRYVGKEPYQKTCTNLSGPVEDH
jgi:energy-coupling factor transporter ATP-binding protein EcfA2